MNYLKLTLFITLGILCQHTLAQESSNKSSFSDSEKLVLRHIDSLKNAKKYSKVIHLLDSMKTTINPEVSWVKYFFLSNKKHRTSTYVGDSIFTAYSLILKEEIEAYATDQDRYLSQFYQNVSYHEDMRGNYPVVVKSAKLSLKHLYLTKDYKPEQLANRFNSLGGGYMNCGRLDSASFYFKEALQLNQSKFPDNEAYALASDNLTNLGIIQKENGQFNEAISYYDRALIYLNKLKNIETDSYLIGKKGIVYYNAGFATMLSGDHQKALDYLLKCHSIFKQAYGPEHPYVGVACNLIAINMDKIDPQQALHYHDKAISLGIKRYGKINSRVAYQMMTKGNTYMLLDSCNLTKSLLDTARSVFNKSFKEIHPHEIQLVHQYLNYFSNCDLNMDSLKHYEEDALKKTIKLYGRKGDQFIILYNQLTRCYLKHELLDKALVYADSSRYYNSISTDNFYSPYNAIASNIMKSSILRKKWKQQNKAVSLVEEIRELNEEAYSLKLTIEKSYPKGSLEDDRYYTNVELNGLTSAVNFYLSNQSKEQFEQILNWSNRYKAQALSIAMNDVFVKKFANVPAETLIEEEAHKIQINRIETAYHDAIVDKNVTLADSIKNNQLFDAKRKLDLFLGQLKVDNPSYFELKYEKQNIDIHELRSNIMSDEIIIDYILDLENNNLVIIAFDQTQETVHNIAIPNNLYEKVIALNKALQSNTLKRSKKLVAFQSLNIELYNYFLKPIQDIIQTKKKLIIIGSGISHYIPFEVLAANKADKLKDINFLIKDHVISYHYSSSLYLKTKLEKNQFTDDLLAFAPVFNDDQNIYSSIENAPKVDFTSRALDSKNRFVPLPYSKIEVNQIAALFPKNSTTLLIEEEATENKLRAELAKSRQFLHIASHSFANTNSPKFSGIVCYQDSSQNEDNILYVGEIYNDRVDFDLVVLSSCESGIGKENNTEGLIGLNRSFIYSGANNVLFSLWKVQDKATNDFMVDFYTNIKNGDSYSEALRRTKLHFISNSETNLPVHWSSFVLIGVR